MEHTPFYIPAVFVLTTILAVWFMYRATHYAKIFLTGTLTWLGIQAIISLSGFYTNTTTLPPRFLLLVAPPLLLIGTLFFTRWGKIHLGKLDLRQLTLLHVVRVPVELVLFWLYKQNVIPQLMTFEGINFDILAGLSAPLVYYFGFNSKLPRTRMLLLWHIAGLLLLLNIVVHAVLSTPSPFQQLAFDQPNIAVLYFPFTWLPGCVVPLVLLAHLVAIKQLGQYRAGRRSHQTPALTTARTDSTKAREVGNQR